MKRETTAASGTCLVPTAMTTTSPNSILADFQITASGARQNERTALAKGLIQMQALFGGIPEFARNTVFTFEERSGYSRYEGLRNGRHQIAMNRCNSKGSGCASNNVAHLMHELAHRIGHAIFSGRENFYSAYERLAGDCQPTSYSKTNSHEEFAEVFSAYLTHPELLSQGSPGCKRSYQFFAKDVFLQNGLLASCQPSAKEELLARAQRPSNRQEIQVASNEVKPPPPSQRKLRQRRPRQDDFLTDLWGEKPKPRAQQHFQTAEADVLPWW